MNPGLKFLLAARECEIGELERVAETSELVSLLGRFMHALQRERGLTNIELASRGDNHTGERLQQVAQCDELQAQVLSALDRLDTDPGRRPNGARLFSRIAVVLHGLDALPALRRQVADRLPTPAEATAVYVRLIANLLAVVFEAADSASDPEVSRALFALFSFMQGKEFAGQERAFGAATFASGHIDADGRNHWQHLIDTQQGCLRLFTEFAEAGVLALDHSSQDAESLAQLERLRRIGLHPCSGTRELDAAHSREWYDACTRRIDGMQRVEDALAASLRRICERRIAQAREGLRDQQALLHGLLRSEGHMPALPGRYGPHMERSVLAMVHEQSRRLQAMSDELDAVRAALNERKVVERAKGLLMAHRQLSEAEAHKVLRTMAMNQNRRLFDVAQAVLTAADVLPGR